MLRITFMTMNGVSTTILRGNAVYRLEVKDIIISLLGIVILLISSWQILFEEARRHIKLTVFLNSVAFIYGVLLLIYYGEDLLHLRMFVEKKSKI